MSHQDKPAEARNESGIKEVLFAPALASIVPSENHRMAEPFVPFHFAINWFTVKSSRFTRGAPLHTDPSSTNNDGGISGCCSLRRGHGPYRAAAGRTTFKETCSGPSGDILDSGNTGKSLKERSIAATLLGYEIVKEREKVTVYKILVQRPEGGSWLIFRRYRDFCILSDKLINLFPSFYSTLPPKRRFKDNYDDRFLAKRQIGLQTFLENLMLHTDIITSEPVRHFLSVVDPMNPFCSTEESRAFCETLEQKNHCLLRDLLEKQKEVDSLKKTLEDKENYIILLWKKDPCPCLFRDLKISDYNLLHHQHS